MPCCLTDHFVTFWRYAHKRYAHGRLDNNKVLSRVQVTVTGHFFAYWTFRLGLLPRYFAYRLIIMPTRLPDVSRSGTLALTVLQNCLPVEHCWAILRTVQILWVSSFLVPKTLLKLECIYR